MRYWPMSVIASSPLLPAPHAAEVSRLPYRAPSQAAYYACFDVAKHTEPTPTGGLAIIESVDAPGRQVYTEYPSWEEWSRLERTGVIEANGSFFIFVDAAH